MRYGLFGRSGLRVSELCLGTMNFGFEGWGIEPAASYAIMETYAAAGGNFLDTAHIYGDGQSERAVGEFIRADRDHFVVATKYTPSLGTDILKAGNSRRTMIRSVEDSLKRLGTDYIDLFYIHMWDFTTPLDEIMRGFDDLVSSGKVVYVAASDVPAWQISRANMLADMRGWAPFIGIQVEYSLARRTPERDLLPMAAELDLGVVAWAPLAGGALVGGSGPRNALRAANASPQVQAVATVVSQIAEMTGHSASQVALAGLRQLGHHPRVLPIVGASSVDQLRSNLACLEITLDREHMAAIDQAGRVDLGFPHEFLASPSILKLTTGDNADRFDNHRAPNRAPRW
ncbi:aldo/keto reductase [Novosphingobium cyanobacteriorum]|uniref:Aldo/keto reductase n=1 Tax=Novosphingobium cyanobacteriorum TaxID=3024215 RepID=A0ABT6CLV6_9SPHN|nr:aldo/keto reductase [Novosphingobium cyanobacteriorum]MDF8334900.1 aldo/keto reductase [Novosphingobium cyanobacteriorum]